MNRAASAAIPVSRLVAALAGCGAIAAQVFLARLHDRQLAAVDPAVRGKLGARP